MKVADDNFVRANTKEQSFSEDASQEMQHIFGLCKEDADNVMAALIEENSLVNLRTQLMNKYNSYFEMWRSLTFV